ncbi:PepSY-associated TM helix domain-containing protein [Marinifilum fragile]|uniref:PepSY-associated TM helix domain-containing protein n=1 Tax=Marinifilum fragile TaxID=570161 RepID=UPI002AA76B4E|nr:PepSY-associated TM helix domain-containing protein [Marinifilum fragile]
MKLWSKKIFNKSIRSLHRDLGYLFIGLTLIYAISGILLVLKKDEQNPSYREIVLEKVAKTNLTPDELKAFWKDHFSDAPKLTRIIPAEDVYNIYVKGGLGKYYPYDGKIELTTYKKIPIYKFVNDIHYNSGKRFSSIAMIYAIGLIFFAISGAVMVKGKKGFKKRGVWLMIIGFIIPVLLFFYT